MEYKMVLVIRNDLKLSCGKLAVQASHAAVQCSESTKKHKTHWYKAWEKEGAKKVAVKAQDLKHLYRLKADAQALDLAAVLISDAGLTEVPPGTVTCLGIGPGPADIMDKVTGNLTLL